MKKKYNNESPVFAEWTTKKLKQESKDYHQTIYEVGCYGSSDIRRLEGILKELDSRGVDFTISTRLSFN